MVYNTNKFKSTDKSQGMHFLTANEEAVKKCPPTATMNRGTNG